MLELNTIIGDCLANTDMDESLRDFFLSERPGIIYGAGNQAQKILVHSRILRKKISFLLVSPGHQPQIPWDTDIPCYQLDHLPDGVHLDNYDIILGIHEKHFTLIQHLLNKISSHLHIYMPCDWDNGNNDFMKIKNNLFNNYDKYEKKYKIPLEKNFSPMKKLYIHASMPTLGRTERAFYYANRLILNKNGIFYPLSLNGSKGHAELFLHNTPEILQGKEQPLHIYLDMLYTGKCKVNLLQIPIVNIKSDFFDFFKKYYSIKYIISMRSPLIFANDMMYRSIIHYGISNNTSMLLFDSCNIRNNIEYQRNKFLYFFNGQLPNNDIAILKSFDKIIESHNFSELCSCFNIQHDINIRIPSIREHSFQTDYAYFIAHASMLPLPQNALLQIQNELLAQQDREKKNHYRLFSRKTIENIPLDIIHEYEALGKRMGDPEFWQRGVDAMLKLDQVPWRQLPEDKQYEIFEKLSPISQKAILDCWPLYRALPGRLQGSGFLPDIPEDKETALLMRRWSLQMHADRL